MSEGGGGGRLTLQLFKVMLLTGPRTKKGDEHEENIHWPWGGCGGCALISHMFWSVYVPPPPQYFECVAVSKCVFVWKHASGLLLQGVRCGGASCIIDVLPRFAHVAPPR